jgi:hypothetical protein
MDMVRARILLTAVYLHIKQYTFYVLTTYSTTSALFCLISVGYHSELRVAKTFTNIIVRHQLRYVTLFNVHTNYTKYDI